MIYALNTDYCILVLVEEKGTTDRTTDRFSR